MRTSRIHFLSVEIPLPYERLPNFKVFFPRNFLPLTKNHRALQQNSSKIMLLQLKNSKFSQMRPSPRIQESKRTELSFTIRIHKERKPVECEILMGINLQCKKVGS